MAEPTLKKGSRDPAVRDLQQAIQPLVSAPSGASDGVFGDDTESDVISFQGDQGIDVDGVVGPVTWRAIDLADVSEPTLRKGSTGNPVRRLQLTISLAGYDTKGVDGKFGANTETAVKQLQKDGALTADGIVGPDTWARVDSLDT
jgi:peptidoglycan hydrolase-like protein with peptidoglycan-binding domain